MWQGFRRKSKVQLRNVLRITTLEKGEQKMEETDLEIEEEREYTPEELGIDYDMTYFDKNKEEIYYESEVENEVQ